MAITPTLVALPDPRVLAAAVAVLGAPAAQRDALPPAVLARADAVVRQHRAAVAQARRLSLTRTQGKKTAPLSARRQRARLLSDVDRIIGRVPGVASEDDMLRKLKSGKSGSNGAPSMNATPTWAFGKVAPNGARYARGRATGRPAVLRKSTHPKGA